MATEPISIPTTCSMNLLPLVFLLKGIMPCFIGFVNRKFGEFGIFPNLACQINKYEIQLCQMRYKEVIVMPMSLRIPIQKENMIEKAAIKERKSKTAFVIEAIDEKLGLVKNRESSLRDFAGWLSSIEAEELRHSTDVFETIQEGDWK